MNKLGDYLLFSNGKTSPKRIDNGAYPVFGANGIIGYSNEYNAEEGTIVIGRVGSYCGSVHYSSKKCWITDNAIICNTKKITDSLFWFYFLKNLNLNTMRSGSGQPLLNQSILKSIEVNEINELNKRIEIGKFLSNFDQKIHLNTQTNQTLEAIAQAIFKSWFVDFDPVRAKTAALSEGKSEHEANLAAMSVICGKDTSELNDTEYKALWQIAEAFPSELVENEQFGEVPKGWEVKKVGDIIQRLKNPQKLKKEHISNLGKTPVFEQGTSILMGYSDENASQNASKDEPIFIFGDHTCITHISTTPFSIYQNVIPLKGSNLPTYWVYWAIKGKLEFQEYRRHYMELIIKEVVIPNNITLCQFFSKLTSPIHQKIDFFREENRNLSQTRDLLLPKLLSGELLNE
ncbi:TPA: restriction endonuclease subunit S [Mannheimia haemolytica]|nr:restriction endonuclease subunit S [Mannheimia haemolytica]